MILCGRLGRQGFFDNVGQWEVKMKVLRDSSNFLIEVSDDPAVRNIKEQVLFIDSRWRDILAAIEYFHKEKKAVELRREYASNFERLLAWLEQREQMISSTVDARISDARLHLQDLNVSCCDCSYGNSVHL